jgi:hypothetical protein
MPTSITVTVDATVASAKLSAIRGTLQARKAIHNAAATAASVLIRRHLLSRNSRSGRSNYWSSAMEATTAESDLESARVIIRHPGIAWHRWGGTINAKPGKALAIPLRDELHGINAKEYLTGKTGAFVYRSKHNKAFLAIRDGKALRILYLLLKSVSKSEDPSVLPADAEISDTASAAIRNLVRRAIRQPK